MSTGIREASFREGDRSEYLAAYILSKLGLVTNVPRQEDIGFDFVCSIADQEIGNLSFNYPFLVSVKSRSKPNARLFPPRRFKFSGAKTFPHIEWLFRQQLPLFHCVIDKKEQEARIFSTAAVWVIYHAKDYRDCGALTLVPRVKKKDPRGFQLPEKRERLRGSHRYHYAIDLNFPLVRLKVSDLTDDAKIIEAKKKLRDAVVNDRVAALLAQIGVPYFRWLATTTPDTSVTRAAFYIDTAPAEKSAEEHLFTQIAPVFVSLALRFKKRKESGNLGAVMKLLKMVPPAAIPDSMRTILAKRGIKLKGR